MSAVLLLLGVVGFAVFLVWLNRKGIHLVHVVPPDTSGLSWCGRCRRHFRFDGSGRAAEQLHSDFDCKEMS